MRHRIPGVKAWLTVVLFAAVGALAGWLCLRVVPLLLVDEGSFAQDADREKAIHDARTSTLQFFAGLVVAIGAIYSARTYALNRESAVTERFTRAIEHLGDQEKIEVRLGGLYALERIARDSPRDQPAVMEVITAFLRGRSPVGTRMPKHAAGEARDMSGARAANLEQDADDRPFDRLDMNAAFSIVARRNPQHDPSARLELSDVDLAEAKAGRGQFQRVRFRRSCLRRAKLSGAVFFDAKLEGADFTDAELQYAWFDAPPHGQTKLVGACLRGANLTGATFARVTLKEADLEGAVFDGATYDPQSTHWPTGFNARSAGLSPMNAGQRRTRRLRQRTARHCSPTIASLCWY